MVEQVFETRGVPFCEKGFVELLHGGVNLEGEIGGGVGESLVDHGAEQAGEGVADNRNHPLGAYADEAAGKGCLLYTSPSPRD